MEALILHAALLTLAVGDCWRHPVVLAGDLVLAAGLCGMAIPGIHLKSHLLEVMVDLDSDTPCGRRERDAGRAALPLLLHVFSLDALKQ